MIAKKSDIDEVVEFSQDFDELADFLDGFSGVELKDDQVQESGEVLCLTAEGHVVSLLHPQDGTAVSWELFVSLNSKVKSYLSASQIDEVNFSEFKPLIALPGDVIAESQADEIEATHHRKQVVESGVHVTFNSKGQFVADTYGFVIIDDGKLNIASPLKVRADKLVVEWLFPSTHPKEIEKQHLEFWLDDLEVKLEPVNHFPELVRDANGDLLEPGFYTVVEGVAPVPGRDGEINWFVNPEQTVGQILEDGRIDFKERSYVVNVSVGDALAEVTLATDGVAGRDVFDCPVAVSDGVPAKIEVGDNVRIEEKDGLNLLFAEIDGAVNFTANKLSVFNVITLANGVNLDTGNIDFRGDVVVQGDVKSGFSVRAHGDIIVTESVEDGAILEAEGTVTVGRGIHGKRTVVTAGASIQAQYVNESLLKAKHDIILGSYAQHAKLRAAGSIEIKGGSGQSSGAMFGGEAWAKEKIEVQVSGSKAWNVTEMVVGIQPEQAERLDNILSDITSKNTHIRQILDFFGLSKVDLQKIKGLIEGAEGAHRKGMAVRAKYLAQSGKALQTLLAEKTALITEIGPGPENAEIIIHQKVYPNVQVSIGAVKQKVEDEFGLSTFKLKDGVLVRE